MVLNRSFLCVLRSHESPQPSREQRNPEAGDNHPVTELLVAHHRLPGSVVEVVPQEVDAVVSRSASPADVVSLRLPQHPLLMRTDGPPSLLVLSVAVVAPWPLERVLYSPNPSLSLVS